MLVWHLVFCFEFVSSIYNKKGNELYYIDGTKLIFLYIWKKVNKAIEKCGYILTKRHF